MPATSPVPDHRHYPTPPQVPLTPRCLPRRTPRPEVPVCGYGACSVSGCPCPGFKDTYGSQLCNNCGHQYTDHW